MACNFSCYMSFTDAQRENDLGVFLSDSGDIYKVRYKSNVCRDLLLRIEWTVSKQILFTVKLYSTSFKRCFSSKGMIINGKKAFMKLRGAFNVSNSRNYKVLCVINLIPYIKFNDSNELPPELIESSDIVESELQHSSIEENDAVTYEEISFRNEKAEENKDVKNNFSEKVNEIIIQNKCENSLPIDGIVQVSSGKKDFKLENIPITEKLIEDSTIAKLKNVTLDKIERSVLAMNKYNLKSYDQDDKTTKNNTVCIHNFESKKEDVEDNFAGTLEDSLFRNSGEGNNASALSNDISTEENAIVRSNSKDEILITKILKLDDYSEEIIENIKTINIHNAESNDTISENYSSMEVDTTELFEEDNSSSESCNKSRVNFSTNITPEISQAEKNECHALSENKDMNYSDVVNATISSESRKADFVLESNDIYANRNDLNEKYDEKHYGEKCLTNLSNCNFGSLIQNSDPSKDNYINPSISKSDFQPTDSHKSSKDTTITEIKDTVADSHKSKSQKLCSSKADLVFQTLAHTLSVADSDLQLASVKEVAISSRRNLKDSLGSEIDNSKIFPIMESELKGLSMDMLDLLTSGDMADAQITNGEKHIKVHRAIVSARSSALKKLFVKNKVDDMNYSAVVDIPTYILEDFLIFLYVGLVYIKNTKMAQDLHQVAEKYCINDLIDICSKHI